MDGSRYARRGSAAKNLIFVKGSMRFTTRAALDEFVGLVLDGVRRIDAVSALADIMVERMYELTEGRLWMGAHMRRGDCESCF